MKCVTTERCCCHRVRRTQFFLTSEVPSTPLPSSLVSQCVATGKGRLPAEIHTAFVRSVFEFNQPVLFNYVLNLSL